MEKSQYKNPFPDNTDRNEIWEKIHLWELMEHLKIIRMPGH